MDVRDPKQSLREWAAKLADEAMRWRESVLTGDGDARSTTVAVEAFWAAAKSLSDALDVASRVSLKAQELSEESSELDDVKAPSTVEWQNLAGAHLQLEEWVNEPPSIAIYKRFMREQFIPAYNAVWGHARKPLCPACGTIVEPGGKHGLFCRKKCKKALAKVGRKQAKGKAPKPATVATGEPEAA